MTNAERFYHAFKRFLNSFCPTFFFLHLYYPLIQHKTLTVYEAKNVLKAFHFILLSARLVVTFSAPDRHRPRAPISTAWTVNRGTVANPVPPSCRSSSTNVKRLKLNFPCTIAH